MKPRLNLSCLIVIGILLLISYKIARPILLRRLTPAEREETTLRLQRANEVIKAELRQFQTVHARWAHSDDTYSFLKHHEIGNERDQYIRTHLMPAVLAQQGVDFAIFLDSAQVSFFRRAINRATQQESLTFSNNLIEELMTQRGIGNDFQEKPVSALFCRPEGMYFVITSPITLSNGRTEVDTLGALIFMRRLMSEDMERIGREAKIDVKLVSMYDTGRYPEMPEVLEAMSPEKPIVVRCMDGMNITAYMRIKDISEESNYVLVGTRRR